MGLHSVFESAVASEQPLQAIEHAIWQSLAAGGKSARHPWNHGVFSTVATQDGKVQSINSRTVILRASDSRKRFIDCHTDVRSQKILDIEQNESASWTFYDHKSKVQLRVCGTAKIINGQHADDAWAATSLRSRSAYLSIEPPGQIASLSDPPSTEDRFVSMQESERGRCNFRVVRLNITLFDWLYLRREGHLRAKFSYEAGAIEEQTWLIP